MAIDERRRMFRSIDGHLGRDLCRNRFATKGPPQYQDVKQVWLQVCTLTSVADTPKGEKRTGEVPTGMDDRRSGRARP